MNQLPPIRCTAPELGKVGVEIVDYIRVRLRCIACGEVWSPSHRSGQLVQKYWRCPRDCNRDGDRNNR